MKDDSQPTSFQARARTRRLENLWLSPPSSWTSPMSTPDSKDASTSLAVTEKDGRIFAGGIAEAKRTFAAVGKALPAKYAFPLDADAAAKLVAQKLKGVALDIVVTKEARTDVPKNDDGTPKFRYSPKIVGQGSAGIKVAEGEYYDE